MSNLSHLESYEMKMGRIGLLIDGMVGGSINSIVVSGAPGIGKTHTVTTKLEEHDGWNVHVTRGHVTPFAMYNLMAEFSGPQDILVFDDADSAFQDESSLNLLKAASDTMPVRTVSWVSSKNSDGVQSFEFEGKVIILTNVEMRRSVHFKAMLDRFLVYNPSITNDEKLHKIKDIAMNSENIEEELGEEIIQFLFDNSHRIEEITIRTFVKIAQLAVSIPDGWKDLATVMVLDSE